MIVACVLRTGGTYDERWVRRLERDVWANLAQHHRFVCLTDIEDWTTDFVEPVPLKHNWPGWWSKMELFRPGLFERRQRVLYLDLDTVVLKELDWAVDAIDCELLLLRDFYRPRGFGSAIMGWEAGRFTQLYNQFAADPGGLMGKYKGRGDQGFIEDRGARFIRAWQEEFPDKIASYKVDCRQGLPGWAHVVCFHGKPRPHEVRADWLTNRWKL